MLDDHYKTFEITIDIVDSHDDEINPSSMQPMTSKLESQAMPFDETDVKDFKLFKGI
jgi:hypothetical protein